MKNIFITECPRDAMQGIKDWIPTKLKSDYLNELLKVGFEVLDFGSFVSPKAIPQLKDTAEVLTNLDLENTSTNLLSIVANKRGAENACAFDEISVLGFPFSISEEFQQRNTNSSLEESLSRVEEIKSLTDKNNKELVIYLSMAFGNPYGEHWNTEVALHWCQALSDKLEINNIALSDTIGVSNPENISTLFSAVNEEFDKINFGAHLHTTPDTWKEKITAALDNGCIRFDGALKGYGGCPMAADELTGNMATEHIISVLNERELSHSVNMTKLGSAIKKSAEIFNTYH